MDISIIQQQINDHGILVGIAIGTILPAVAGPILGAASKLILKGTAKIIPPVASAVRGAVRAALAIPLVRAIIIPHKKEVKELEDVIINALTAVVLAVDLAFDSAIDEEVVVEPNSTEKPK